VDTARELFLQKGFEATSIAEILRESGVNSGSLYYFFKTKEELLLAVLDWYVANLYREVIDPAVAQTKDAIGRVFAVLDGYREYLTITEFRQGCPIGNLALEMSEKSEAVREKVVLNFENWRKAIRQLLFDAGDLLPADVDRDALATFVLGVMEGGVMLSRTYRSLAPFQASIAMLRAHFDRLAAEANSTRNRTDC